MFEMGWFDWLCVAVIVFAFAWIFAYILDATVETLFGNDDDDDEWPMGGKLAVG